MSKRHSLYTKFPPSPPCACDTCRYFCHRPGWWLVSEARQAMENGYAPRMMLEIAPDFSFGVLSPAFKGNEGFPALQELAHNACTFLADGCCELFNQPFRPIECRFAHHDHITAGEQCHLEIEKEWNTNAGKRLVKQWLHLRSIVLPSQCRFC